MSDDYSSNPWGRLNAMFSAAPKRSWWRAAWEEWAIPVGIGAAIVGLLVLLVFAAIQSDKEKHVMLGRAKTFADTLAVEQLWEEKARTTAISFGAGLVAGSAAARR